MIRHESSGSTFSCGTLLPQPLHLPIIINLVKLEHSKLGLLMLVLDLFGLGVSYEAPIREKNRSPNTHRKYITQSAWVRIGLQFTSKRMGGSSSDDEWEFASSTTGIRNIVLVGRTGNGKSATGNSILGKKEFKSRASSAGVTSTCELKTTVLSDGQILNVIDTPGLFDFSAESEHIGKEIVKCINMAKDGIHAVLIVFSVRTRFSKEEENALRSLQKIFGEKINDYMIVVFTGGDELEDSDETLEDYLGRDCPQPLKEIINLCENRRVLFDNKTKDEFKKAEQRQQLLSLVNKVMVQNSAQPFTNELFAELKRGAMKLRNQAEEVNSLEGYTKSELTELREQMHKSYEEQLRGITEMVESKLKETTSRLEQQLASEQAARLKAEEFAQMAQTKSNDEIRKLRENLERAQRETEELRKQAESVLKKGASSVVMLTRVAAKSSTMYGSRIWSWRKVIKRKLSL